MDDCCNNKKVELTQLAINQSRVLKLVLLINLTMFFVEAVSGWIAKSTALLADSLDMLGDAFVYGISLYAIKKGSRWQASVSIIKGSIMGLFGLGVMAETIRRFISPALPTAETMGIVGAVALVANLSSAILLLRHRNDDINMRSTWLCSRNDVIANLGIIIAALLVSITQSKYPDLIVGAIIAGLVLKSSIQVLTESKDLLRKSEHPTPRGNH